MKCKLDKSNILIAGGTGFIGKRLVKKLSFLGSNVYVISRKQRRNEGKITFLKGDLTDISSLKPYGDMKFDACVYMAANIPEVGAKKETYLDAKESTLDPLVNFCECFTKEIDKFVYISSIDVLGVCEEELYDECTPPSLTTPYGLAKYCGEFYTKSYCAQNNIQLITLRFSQVFGPNEPIVRIIPIMRNSLVLDKKFTIYSDGTEKRRFLFVDDAVEAIIRALEKNVSGLFNIAGDEICSIKDLAYYMEEVYCKTMKLEILNKIQGKSNVPSNDKAKKLLSFIPRYSVKEGLIKIREEEKC